MDLVEAQIVPSNIRDKNVLNKLRRTIKTAEALRGCVAFWVIKPEVFGNDFIELLKNKDSFYCIDIHSPTDLESIESHCSLGDNQLNLLLHLKKTNKPKTNLSLPRHLLHAKIMLFDLPGNRAEIWIGSHNLTNRALFAGNIEASTVITCSRDSSYYFQVNNYLHQIKDECEPFDPELMEVYLSIQNESAKTDKEGENIYIIPIIGKNIDQLLLKTILLLGDSYSDLQSLGLSRVTQTVFVHAIDLVNRQEALYEAKIRSSGEILVDEPLTSEMRFEKRLYAIREDSFFPYQGDQTKEIAKRDLEKYRYWANIAIVNKLENFKLKPSPTTKNKYWSWVRINTKPYKVEAQPISKKQQWGVITEITKTYKAVIDKNAKDLLKMAKQEQPVEAFPFLKNLSEENIIAAQKHYSRNFEEILLNHNYQEVPVIRMSTDKAFDNPELLAPFQRTKLGEKMRLVRKKPSNK